MKRLLSKYNTIEDLHTALISQPYKDLNMTEKLALNAAENIVAGLEAEEDMLSLEGTELYFHYKIKDTVLFNDHYDFEEDHAYINGKRFSKEKAQEYLNKKLQRYWLSP